MQINPSIRRIFYIIVSILVLYIIGIFFIYIFIDYIVFSPVRHSPNQKYQLELVFRELRLDHPTGEKINMLSFEPQGPVKGYILFLHGLSKSADFWAEYAPFFTERGMKLYIPDYRGYGKSRGQANEIGIYEDAQISLAWLKTQTTEDSIVLYGVDLAASAAAFLSTVSPCRQVILENPVYSLRSWMRQKFPLLMLPYELKYDFNIYEFIPNIISPLTVVQSKNISGAQEEDAKRIERLLKDPGAFIWTDQPKERLPIEDPQFIKYFDQLINSL